MKNYNIDILLVEVCWDFSRCMSQIKWQRDIIHYDCRELKIKKRESPRARSSVQVNIGLGTPK